MQLVCYAHNHRFVRVQANSGNDHLGMSIHDSYWLRPVHRLVLLRCCDGHVTDKQRSAAEKEEAADEASDDTE